MMKAKASGSPPKKKSRLTWKGRLFLIGFGFVLVGLVEVGLRLAGFGGVRSIVSPMLTKKNDDGGLVTLYETNQSFLEPFFTRTADDGIKRSGSMVRERFFDPKPADVFRVVLIGESTIQGFPQPRNLTSSAFLQQYLHFAMPDRKVEVLNFGATAVASFPIRKIGERVLEHLDPDVLIVYGAHNEFFGASGMASFQRLGTNVTMMQLSWWLRQTGTVGAVEALQKKLARNAVPKETGGAKTLIEIMAGTNYVDPNGALHRAAEKSIRANWDGLRRAGFKRGIPVVFCTVASNEAGIAPFVSSHEGMSEQEEKALTTKLNADTSHTLPVSYFEGQLKLTPPHALLHYRYAQRLEEDGEKEKSAEEYRTARDLDALPWRASRSKNRLIRELATRPGALLADAEKTFAEEAGGATGWNLFDDHVHPSLRGQALLAETIFHTMENAGLLKGAGKSKPPAWTTFSSALGAAPLERFRVINMMTSIFEKPPMRLNNEDAYHFFDSRMKKMMKEADSVEKEAILHWNTVSVGVGESMPMSYFATAAALRQNKPAVAGQYMKGAVYNADPFSDEYIAARFLQFLTMAQLGAKTEELETQRKEIEERAVFVAGFPNQPSILLSHVQAALALWRKDEQSAKEFEAKMNSGRTSAGTRTKLMLNELPPPEVLPGVIDQIRDTNRKLHEGKK